MTQRPDLPASADRVCVIIAARNAERTIARAIQSALIQTEVAEVVVVDDASTDATAAVAAGCEDGSGRIKLIRLAENAGPSAARNRAIADSTAPYIAILDADDFLMPGRFAQMFAVSGWDLIADNIAFIDESAVDHFAPGRIARFEPDPAVVDLATFIAGNISIPGKPRGELGFAKPVIRRSLLDQAEIRYDERLRFGEDFALYARLLAAGARFVTIRTCGYVAVVRNDSLSGRHRTQDLVALLDFDDGFLRALAGEPRRVLEVHRARLAGNVHHRQILDLRQSAGRWRAAMHAARNPKLLPDLVVRVLRDKLSRPISAGAAPDAALRYLF